MQVWVALTLIFFAIQVVPGDPAEVLASAQGAAGDISPEALDKIREQLGLNQDLLTRYFGYLQGLVTGDLGLSFATGTSVSASIGRSLPNTIEIVLLGAVIGALAGILLGSWAGRGGRLVQLTASAITSLGISIPVYVLGSLLILYFALTLGWFPAGGYRSFDDDPVRHMRLLVLPAITLALAFMAIVARMTASSIREVSRQDWVRTSRSLGLSSGVVFRQDILRNSLNPVVTVVGVEVGTLLGGTVLVERIFNWPGIGTLLVDAVSDRDYPMVQGIVIVISIIFIAINILVDIIYGFLDPRVSPQ